MSTLREVPTLAVVLQWFRIHLVNSKYGFMISIPLDLISATQLVSLSAMAANDFTLNNFLWYIFPYPLVKDMYVHVYVLMCTSTWVDEYRHVKARGQCWGSFSVILHWTSISLVTLDWLVTVPKRVSVLLFPCTGIIGSCCCNWLFMWMLEIWT